MSEKEPGFKVVDRRGRSTGPEPAAQPPTEAHDERVLGPLDFTTFILSLGSSAAIHLGDVPDPETGQRHKNVPQAKQIIDLLGMLEDKTRGNLTDDEAKFLKGLLYDLRLRFVEASQG